MPRKSPPTIYTCISEPDGDGVRVIRYSSDPEALDSLPTQSWPPPELVSKSRVAFVYEGDPGEEILVSCRGERHDRGMSFWRVDPFSPVQEAMNWLIGED